MELRDLRLVVALADELHFGRAAQRLHIGQPALSMQLRRLERRLAVELFDRNTHGVRITEAGTAFATQARSILARVDDLEDGMRSHRPLARLRLGSLLPAYDVSQQLLRALHQHLPDIAVSEREIANFAAARAQLTQGDIDLYIGIWVPDDALLARPLRSDPFGVYVAADDPLATRTAIPLTELDGVPLLVDPDDSAPEYVGLVEQMFVAGGSNLVRSTSGSGSPVAAVAAVAWGGPPVVGPRIPTPEGVRWVPFAGPGTHATLHVVWRRSEPPPQVDRALTVVRALADEAGWLVRGDDRALITHRDHVMANHEDHGLPKHAPHE